MTIMATFFCNKCKKAIGGYDAGIVYEDNKIIFDVHKLNYHKRSSTNAIISYILCDACLSDFKLWIGDNNKRNKKTNHHNGDRM